jgi:hypothetical protein
MVYEAESIIHNKALPLDITSLSPFGCLFTNPSLSVGLWLNQIIKYDTPTACIFDITEKL